MRTSTPFSSCLRQLLPLVPFVCMPLCRHCEWGEFSDIILIFLMLFISMALRVTDYFAETLFPVAPEI
ncbi:hypothetical protein RM437_24420 [Citrobacter werkmanii]|uniref:hypothetical protein n=1 Tax=Citrobacter werkmanii TaxID=67827 RepID=UPI002886D210|nr:hypothetical protein [Citrobacter werkmanii]MDT0641168.1 hypothetical protein [Citrobacter werkmanii]